MATLPTNRTTANTEAEHVDDHNELHGEHNKWQDFDALAPTTVDSGDLVAVEDISDGNNKRKVTAQAIADLGVGGSDGDAIHDNVAGEISALTNVAAASGDHVLIEDLDDSNDKKRVTAQSIADLADPTDATALHEDVAGEITGLPDTAVASGDWLVAEDVSDSNDKKRVSAQSIADLAGAGGDSDAIHDNVAGEIAAISPITVVGGDYLVAEDAGSGNVKGRVTAQDIADLGAGGGDATAIHDDEAGEIVLITGAAAAAADILIMEDTSDGNNKKKVTAQSIADLSGGTSSLFYNVVDYGAVGDGVTDDTAAFEAAFADADDTGGGTRGGIVWVPPLVTPNSYLVNDCTLPPTNWGYRVEGGGMGSYIKNSTGHCFVMDDCTKVTMRNMRINSHVSGKAAILLTDCSVCTFQDMYLGVATAGAFAIDSERCYDLQFLNNIYAGDGVAMSGPIVRVISPTGGDWSTNEFLGGRVIGSATATGGPLFYFSARGANYLYGVSIRDINFEIPNYGMIWAEGANNWVLDRINAYDLSTTFQASMIRLSKYSTGLDSVACTITNCMMVTNESRGAFWDIDTAGPEHTIINSGGHLTPNAKINVRSYRTNIIGARANSVVNTENSIVLDTAGGEITVEGVVLDGAAGGGGPGVTVLDTTSETLTAAGTYICDTDTAGGNMTVTMPSAAAEEGVVSIKRIGAYEVYIVRAGSDHFDLGATTQRTLFVEYAAAAFASPGSGTTWHELGQFGNVT